MPVLAGAGIRVPRHSDTKEASDNTTLCTEKWYKSRLVGRDGSSLPHEVVHCGSAAPDGCLWPARSLMATVTRLIFALDACMWFCVDLSLIWQECLFQVSIMRFEMRHVFWKKTALVLEGMYLKICACGAMVDCLFVFCGIKIGCLLFLRLMCSGCCTPMWRCWLASVACVWFRCLLCCVFWMQLGAFKHYWLSGSPSECVGLGGELGCLVLCLIWLVCPS